MIPMKKNEVTGLDNLTATDAVTIFHATTDMLPVSKIQQFCDCKCKVIFVEIESRDEMLINVGFILNSCNARDEIYLLDDEITIPEKLLAGIKLTVVDNFSKKKVTKPKKETTTVATPGDAPVKSERGRKRKVVAPVETTGKTEDIKGTEPVIEKKIDIAPTNTEVTEKKDMHLSFTPEPINSETMENETIAAEPVLEKEILTGEPIKESVNNLTTEPIANAMVDFVNTDTTAESDDIINKFVKQMGVRAKDIDYEGTDEDLAKELAYLIAAISPKLDIHEAIKDSIQEVYSDEESEKILKWVKPAIVKLHELAVQYVHLTK